MHVQHEAAGVVVRFGPLFSAEDAVQLPEFVPPQVTLDFRDVENFEEAGILPLAVWLRRNGEVKVRLRGLSIHQARMLAYFGIRDLDNRQDGNRV